MLHVVGEGLQNPTRPALTEYHKAFKAKYPQWDLTQPRIINAVPMLAEAINKAGTADDMVAVARALEGMEFYSKILGTRVLMRKKDHQAIQNVHVGVHTDDVEIDYDNSGYGIKVFKTIEMASINSPTTCKMNRP